MRPEEAEVLEAALKLAEAAHPGTAPRVLGVSVTACAEGGKPFTVVVSPSAPSDEKSVDQLALAVLATAGKPLAVKVIATRMGRPGMNLNYLRRVLRRLDREGRARKAKGGYEAGDAQGLFVAG